MGGGGGTETPLKTEDNGMSSERRVTPQRNAKRKRNHRLSNSSIDGSAMKRKLKMEALSPTATEGRQSVSGNSSTAGDEMPPTLDEKPSLEALNAAMVATSSGGAIPPQKSPTSATASSPPAASLAISGAFDGTLDKTAAANGMTLVTVASGRVDGLNGLLKPTAIVEPMEASVDSSASSRFSTKDVKKEEEPTDDEKPSTSMSPDEKELKPSSPVERSVSSSPPVEAEAMEPDDSALAEEVEEMVLTINATIPPDVQQPRPLARPEDDKAPDGELIRVRQRINYNTCARTDILYRTLATTRWIQRRKERELEKEKERERQKEQPQKTSQPPVVNASARQQKRPTPTPNASPAVPRKVTYSSAMEVTPPNCCLERSVNSAFRLSSANGCAVQLGRLPFFS
jgi:hypothetical protein